MFPIEGSSLYIINVDYLPQDVQFGVDGIIDKRLRLRFIDRSVFKLLLSSRVFIELPPLRSIFCGFIMVGWVTITVFVLNIIFIEKLNTAPFI